MSRNQKAIIKAIEAKGYTAKIRWEPIGTCLEMCGPEGGWEVRVEEDGELYDYILGYNIRDVLSGIEKLPICEENRGVKCG